MPIAIYHLEAKVISRGAGRSAVAASAYMSCSRIYNDYDGVQHDYTRKHGLVWQQVFLPECAPPEWKDHAVLWNAVEEAEKTKDSRLAREFVVALPIELSLVEQQRLLTDFIKETFIADGMCADVCIHDTEAAKHGYVRADKHPKSTKYGRQNPISARWNSEQQLDLWRKAWADRTNAYLEQAGCAERIDHRSHAERGLDEQPTVHEGVQARAMENKGFIADRCELNRQIKADNALLRELKTLVKDLMQKARNSMPALADAMEALRADMLVFCYQLRHIQKGRKMYSDYLEAALPELEKYDELTKQIKSTVKARKELQTEKKATPAFNVLKHRELTSRIEDLTEQLEDLRSERNMILQYLNCEEGGGAADAQKKCTTAETMLKKLEVSEAKYSYALDDAKVDFARLQEQAKYFDAAELYETRLAVREEKEQDAEHRLQKAYVRNYDEGTMQSSKDDIYTLLPETCAENGRFDNEIAEQQYKPVTRRKAQNLDER